MIDLNFGYSGKVHLTVILVNEAPAAVLVSRPPVYSKQQQTGSSGEFLSFGFTHTRIQTGKQQEFIRNMSHLLRKKQTNKKNNCLLYWYILYLTYSTVNIAARGRITFMNESD